MVQSGTMERGLLLSCMRQIVAVASLSDAAPPRLADDAMMKQPKNQQKRSSSRNVHSRG